MQNRKHVSLAMILWSLAATKVHAAGEDLSDLAARLQFEYFAGDTRALQRDLSVLEALDVEEPKAILKKYHLTYGHMKLAEILAEKERSDARKAAERCAEHADSVVKHEPQRVPPRDRQRLDTLYAELWAMQGACEAAKAELSLMPGSQSVSFASMASSKAREKADALAPNNVRVRLLAAIYATKRADNQKEQVAAHELLVAVCAQYDEQPLAAPDMPDWGQAEALAWLGYSHLRRGDQLAARNAIERALVLAPDFVWAKKLLAQMRRPK